ncbi:hypothetical protein BKA65DRAFT_462530 [Rhexocercosporidium sp. MPI-PUGE-AT-0058]|nr:hypothetical protein BKA65DRAFT_462530 [Rhexocercosporidium sp. MPI-PUGE-AT-0058]
MSEYSKLPLSDSDQEIQNEDRLISESTQGRRNILAWIWCGICTIISVLAVTSTVITRSQLQSSGRTISKLPNDFISTPDIPYKDQYFYTFYDYSPSHRGLEFNATGVPILYAGYPTKEIDDAWGELLTGTYMEISDEERESVQKVAPWDLEELVEDKVYMEVSVFHNLHCLDLVRRALNPEHYDINTDFTKQLEPQYRLVHVYHCIDQLRQAIQCQSDLTPVPLFSVEGPQKKFFATHSVSHTCRDFEAVKSWTAERNKENAPFDWNAWTG